MHNSKAGTAIEEKKSQLKNRYLNKGKSTMGNDMERCKDLCSDLFFHYFKKTCCKDDHFSNQ